jgi:hypothetical protein
MVGTRVGIVWAADSRLLEAEDRTAHLADIAPLAQVAGVRLFILQVGRHAAQLSTPPEGMVVEDLSPAFQTLPCRRHRSLGWTW